VLERANKSDYGLAAGIWAKGERFLGHLAAVTAASQCLSGDMTAMPAHADVSVINTLSRGLKAGTVWVSAA
jgi:hypothetical protein